ncbi:MAG TPA: hypothetical protein VFY16_06070, partial [Gemmatimonadaceae bacterium]|nr:hypothetical protein [Gemmatimonadaceae bacterium]
HTFPPARRRRPAIVRACVATLAAVALATPAAAQQVDSARVAPRGSPERPSTLQRVDSGPPISPGRAFLSSVLLPGLGQARLDRPLGVGLFGTVEAGAVVMIVKSLHDLRVAKRYARDSLIVEYERDANGNLVIDPLTGAPRATLLTGRYNEELVRARRLHLEDWIAVLVFNHIIAGADAFVAAHLWDVPGSVSARITPSGAMLGAAIRW